MINKLPYILLTLLFLFTSCKDPSVVDANREIIIIHDPNYLPPVLKITPEIIDFGIVHPGKTVSKEFLITNITDKPVVLDKIQAKNFLLNYTFNTLLPFTLEPQNNSGDKKSISFSFKSDETGKYDDKIDWGTYKNPVTIINAKVASVWAEDINFETTKVGSFDLKFLKIYNSSSVTATITEFTIVDEDGVIINEPSVELPLVIEPKSNTKDIILTFYPKDAKIFNPQIKIKVTYSSGENFTDETINLVGRGSY
jgi:hypothetical protein